MFLLRFGRSGEGGKGGEEAKIEREERSASGGGVDWPQTEEQVTGRPEQNFCFSI